MAEGKIDYGKDMFKDVPWGGHVQNVRDRLGRWWNENSPKSVEDRFKDMNERLLEKIDNKKLRYVLSRMTGVNNALAKVTGVSAMVGDITLMAMTPFAVNIAGSIPDTYKEIREYPGFYTALKRITDYTLEQSRHRGGVGSGVVKAVAIGAELRYRPVTKLTKASADVQERMGGWFIDHIVNKIVKGGEQKPAQPAKTA